MTAARLNGAYYYGGYVYVWITPADSTVAPILVRRSVVLGSDWEDITADLGSVMPDEQEFHRFALLCVPPPPGSVYGSAVYGEAHYDS